MSRFALPLTLLTASAGLVLSGIAVPGTALAQNAASDADRRIQEAIDAQRATIDTRPPECRNRSRLPGEIVVCGSREADEKERIPLRDQTEAAQSVRDGLPRAPDVSGLPDCSRGCIGFGKVPPPMYYFDITALPEAPPGSDADRIAKGEMPAP